MLKYCDTRFSIQMLARVLFIFLPTVKHLSQKFMQAVTVMYSAKLTV